MGYKLFLIIFLILSFIIFTLIKVEEEMNLEGNNFATIKFEPEIEERLKLVLGNFEKQPNLSRDIYIVGFDKENFRFIDNENNTYRIGTIINKLWNIDENDQRIFDAVIGSLIYDLGKTNDSELVKEIYQGEAYSCLRGIEIADLLWEKLVKRDKTDNLFLYYVKNGDKYIGRCIVNEETGERGEIYTNGDKYCFSLLDVLLCKYEEVAKYDLNSIWDLLLSIIIKISNKGIKTGKNNIDLEKLKEVSNFVFNDLLLNIFDASGLRNFLESEYGQISIFNLYQNDLISLELLEEMGFQDITPQVYQNDNNYIFLFDERNYEIIGGDLIELEEEVNGFKFVDISSVQKFYEEYKDDLSDENLEIIEEYLY